MFREFDTRWDENLLSMRKIPTDDVLESFYTLPIRESDQLKTVLEFYELEIHQKISEMVKEKKKDQKIKSRNFQARNWRSGKGAVVKNRRDKQRC